MVAMTAMRHRSVFLTCILAMTFLTKPLYKRARKDKLNVAMVVDLILIAMAIFIGFYIFIDLQGIFERQGNWSPWDFRVGVALVLLVLEATRRVIGLNLTLIAIMFLLFGYFGPWMPELIVHKGYGVERIATTLSLTTEGIFGLPLGVASTFVCIFILFGAFLDKTGAGCNVPPDRILYDLAVDSGRPLQLDHRHHGARRVLRGCCRGKKQMGWI